MGSTALGRPPAPPESAWQAQVVQLAVLRGWRCFHDHDSRRNTAGLPDLILCRRGRLIFAELKTNTGRTSAEQDAWLGALALVAGVEVFLWRPADLEDVQRVLR